jgi:hypothetical protein
MIWTEMHIFRQLFKFINFNKDTTAQKKFKKINNIGTYDKRWLFVCSYMQFIQQ